MAYEAIPYYQHCLGSRLAHVLDMANRVPQIMEGLVLLGWGLAPLIFIGGVAHIFHAFGWRRCLVGEARSLPLFQVFRILMAGYSINYLTPTATLGGEVTKGTLLSVNHNGTEAVAGVIVGKLAYSLAQLLSYLWARSSLSGGPICRPESGLHCF